MKEISPRLSTLSALPSEVGETNSLYSSATENNIIRDYWAVLVKRRNLIVFVSLAIFGIGAYSTLSSTPLYVANATIKIEPQNPRVTGITELLPSQAGTTSPYDYYQTQFALLGSRALGALVVSELKLESDKSFMNSRVISANPVDRIRGTLARMFQWLLPSKQQETTKAAHDASAVSNVESRINQELLGRYRGYLKVKPIKNTRLVEIQFTTPDPDLSQRLTNAHATGFIRMTMEAGFDLTEEARKFLNNKNAELKKELEKSEAALNQFRQIHGVVSLEKGENVIVDRLMEINRALTTAKAQRIDAESFHRTVQSKDSQSLSQVLREGLVPTLRGNLAALEAERTKLATVLQPEHPSMQELTQRISEARRSINNEIATVVRGIEGNYAAALDKEKALQAEANRQQQRALNLKQVGVEYAVLEEEVKVNKGLYESILKRLNETHIANDLTLTNMRIVERADKPFSPSYPNTVVNLFLSAVVGLILGAGLAFGLDHLDSSVSTPRDVWRAVQLATFGVIPTYESPRLLLDWKSPGNAFRRALPRLGVKAAHGSSNVLTITDNPSSIIAESYRTIRTAFLFSQADMAPQIVVLTSPSPSDGKTMTTLNLAIALAQDGHRVLIIDADLRRGCCHTRLNAENHKGLSDVLTGSIKVEEAIQPTRIHDMLFLMSGGSRQSNCGDLFGSDKMRAILTEVRASFRFILIDSPPVIAVSDAAILSVASDGVILIFHGRNTTMSSARQALERLHAVRAPLLGVILNGVNLAHPEYAYYRHYYGLRRSETSEQHVNNGHDTVRQATSPDLSAVETPREDSGRAPLSQGGSSVTHTAEQSGNDSRDTIIEAFTTASPVTRTLETNANGEMISQAFFNEMTSKFSEAVGPMAPLIIEDLIRDLGESPHRFPRSRLKELLERVDDEILDDRLRKHFHLTMQEQLTVYCLSDVRMDEILMSRLGHADLPPRVI